MAIAPITEDLFTMGDSPRLVGGRCPVCDAITFPVRSGCPRCGATGLLREELADRGTLYSWTSQGFPPKAPFRGEALVSEPFSPWYVGLVEIPGSVRVEALLVDVEETDLEFGMAVKLVLTPFRTDATTGDEIVTFAFAPDKESVRD